MAKLDLDNRIIWIDNVDGMGDHEIEAIEQDIYGGNPILFGMSNDDEFDGHRDNVKVGDEFYIAWREQQGDEVSVELLYVGNVFVVEEIGGFWDIYLELSLISDTGQSDMEMHREHFHRKLIEIL